MTEIIQIVFKERKASLIIIKNLIAFSDLLHLILF